MRKVVRRKIEVVKAAASTLPLNSFGLPDGYYRPDLLPTTLLPEHSDVTGSLPVADAINDVLPSGCPLEGDPVTTETDASSDADNDASSIGNQESQELTVTNGARESILDRQVLQNAYTPLMYDEGFPTQPDGRPFWDRLEFEAVEAFEAFKVYLNQGRAGARQVYDLDVYLSDKRIIDSEVIGDTNDDEDFKQFQGQSSDGSNGNNGSNGGNGNATYGAHHNGGYSNSLLHVPEGYMLPDSDTLQEYYNLHYWAIRARAYD
ncbi:hypothetical protein LCGC14_2344340, partial [marine sediment metagenome]